MSLKDEIDKLISAERALLEQRDAKGLEFSELQKLRFLPLRAVLEQLIKAVDPAYLQVQYEDARATLTVGKHRDNSFQSDIQWDIIPNSQYIPEAGKAWIEAQPGFSIAEVTIFHVPKPDRSERTYTFATEEEVVQHILKKMAEKIAHYQHFKELADKRNSKDLAS